MDCLLTKLTGEVTDGTLAKIDEVSLYIKLTSSESINDRKIVVRNSTSSATARIVGNGHFTDSTNTSDLGKTATVGNVNTTLYLSNGEYLLFIPKNQLATLQFSMTKGGIAEKRLESLKYSPISYLNFKYMSFQDGLNVTDLRVVYMVIVDLSSTKTKGDIADFSAAASLNSLNISNCAGITGNIAGIGACKSMTALYLNNTINVTGDLEDLLDSMYANGRTSGTFTVNIAGSGVKYAGSSLLLSTFTFSAGGWSKN